MNNVACSNGVNGLASRFPTFGSVPSFPFIGGAFDVVFNSTNCGGCWSLTNPTTGTTINLATIDTAGPGFNIAKEAFEELTNGQIGAGASMWSPIRFLPLSVGCKYSPSLPVPVPSHSDMKPILYFGLVYAVDDRLLPS
jgi:Cerato-platanin